MSEHDPLLTSGGFANAKVIESAVNSSASVKASLTEPPSAAKSSPPPASARPCILTYHEIVPDRATYFYSVTVPQFEDHLRIIADLVPSSLNGAATVQVTFDDGHISNHRCALSVLDKYSIRATFFITVGWIGQRRDAMSWSDLRDLATSGHAIQSHGYTHKLFTQCSDRELIGELRRSKQTLEDKLGTGVDAVSAPGGRWDHRTLLGAAAERYLNVYTSNPWMNPVARAGVNVQGRIMVNRNMDGEKLHSLIHIGKVPLFLQRTKFWAKASVKLALGDTIYQRIWRVLARQNRDYSGFDKD